MKDYEQTFGEFWASLVCNGDGTLNRDAVMRELHDYRQLLENVPKVYDHVSGGRLSKVNTDPVHVIAAHDEACDGCYEDGRTEELDRIVGLIRGKFFTPICPPVDPEWRRSVGTKNGWVMDIIAAIEREAERPAKDLATARPQPVG